MPLSPYHSVSHSLLSSSPFPDLSHFKAFLFSCHKAFPQHFPRTVYCCSGAQWQLYRWAIRQQHDETNKSGVCTVWCRGGGGGGGCCYTRGSVVVDFLVVVVVVLCAEYYIYLSHEWFVVKTCIIMCSAVVSFHLGLRLVAVALQLCLLLFFHLSSISRWWLLLTSCMAAAPWYWWCWWLIFWLEVGEKEQRNSRLFTGDYREAGNSHHV